MRFDLIELLTQLKISLVFSHSEESKENLGAEFTLCGRHTSGGTGGRRSKRRKLWKRRGLWSINNITSWT